MAARLPLFPLDLVLLPTAPLPLHIFEDRYKKMIGRCLELKEAGKEGEFGVVWASQNGVARSGCSAHIIEVARRYPDGRMDILTVGMQRFNIEHIDSESAAYSQADVEYFEDEETAPDDASTRTLRRNIVELHKQILRLLEAPDEIHQEADAALKEDDDLAFALARMLPRDLDLKQQLLVSRKPLHRLKIMREYYVKLIPEMERTRTVRSRAGHNGFGKLPK
jgi:Lon protease-like protein